MGPRLGVDGIDATPKMCGCKIICCFIKVVNHLIGNMRSVTFHAPRQLKDTQKIFEPGEKLSGISPLFDTQIPKELYHNYLSGFMNGNKLCFPIFLAT